MNYKFINYINKHILKHLLIFVKTIVFLTLVNKN